MSCFTDELLCVNELRVLKKNRYMKNLHKKVIIDDTGVRVDNVSV